MTAFYNEIDPYAAQWLRNLIASGHIAHGVVDERSIEDIEPAELDGYTQCHFFAGIGVWSLALRNAGWPDDRPVWTGSCPCQPFSSAGKGAGFDDERHLWPAFHHLIEQCRPPVVIGEQVASKDADTWIDLVQADLEGMGYAFGAVPFPSSSIGAPHIRDRLYWVADSSSDRLDRRRTVHQSNGRYPTREQSERLCSVERLADTQLSERRAGDKRGAIDDRQTSGRIESANRIVECRDADGMGHSTGNRSEVRRHVHGELSGQGLAERCNIGGLADTNGDRLATRGGIRLHGEEHDAEYGGSSSDERPSPTNGFWADADWLFCRDGKWRPVEPGTFPLAHGAAGRVGRLRAYGNAINAVQAQIFVECLM